MLFNYLSFKYIISLNTYFIEKENELNKAKNEKTIKSFKKMSGKFINEINIETSKPLKEQEKFRMNDESKKQTKQKNRSKATFNQKKPEDKGSWQKIVISFQKLVNKKNELKLSYFQYIKEYSCCSKSKIYDVIYKSVKEKLDIKTIMTSVYLENNLKRNNSF